MTYKDWRNIERTFAKVNEILKTAKDIEDKGMRNNAIDSVREINVTFVTQLQQEIDDAWN